MKLTVPANVSAKQFSAASNTVALTQLKDGVYSLVYVDWDTGEEVSKVSLGKSPIEQRALLRTQTTTARETQIRTAEQSKCGCSSLERLD